MRTAEIPTPAAITEIIKANVAIVDTGMIALSSFTFFHLLLSRVFTTPPPRRYIDSFSPHLKNIGPNTIREKASIKTAHLKLAKCVS
ncbi:hypothetical protein ES703_30831 [subsurface metagenome]